MEGLAARETFVRVEKVKSLLRVSADGGTYEDRTYTLFASVRLEAGCTRGGRVILRLFSKLREVLHCDLDVPLTDVAPRSNAG